jgi:hypothetical protein
MSRLAFLPWKPKKRCDPRRYEHFRASDPAAIRRVGARQHRPRRGASGAASLSFDLAYDY